MATYFEDGGEGTNRARYNWVSVPGENGAPDVLRLDCTGGDGQEGQALSIELDLLEATALIERGARTLGYFQRT